MMAGGGQLDRALDLARRVHSRFEVADRVAVHAADRPPHTLSGARMACGGDLAHEPEYIGRLDGIERSAAQHRVDVIGPPAADQDAPRMRAVGPYFLKPLVRDCREGVGSSGVACSLLALFSGRWIFPSLEALSSKPVPSPCFLQADLGVRTDRERLTSAEEAKVVSPGLAPAVGDE